MRLYEKLIASVLLVSYTIKSQVLSPSYSDSIIIAALAVFIGYMCYLEQTAQPDIKQELLDVIADSDKKLSDLVIEKDQEQKRLLLKHEQEITQLKDDIGQIGIVAKRGSGSVQQQYKF